MGSALPPSRVWFDSLLVLNGTNAFLLAKISLPHGQLQRRQHWWASLPSRLQYAGDVSLVSNWIPSNSHSAIWQHSPTRKRKLHCWYRLRQPGWRQLEAPAIRFQSKSTRPLIAVFCRHQLHKFCMKPTKTFETYAYLWRTYKGIQSDTFCLALHSSVVYSATWYIAMFWKCLANAVRCWNEYCKSLPTHTRTHTHTCAFLCLRAFLFVQVFAQAK